MLLENLLQPNHLPLVLGHRPYGSAQKLAAGEAIRGFKAA